MGIYAQVVDKFRHAWAAMAWLPETYATHASGLGPGTTARSDVEWWQAWFDPRRKRTVGVVDDFLTRWMKVDREKEWTLDELFERFFCEARRSLFQRKLPCDTYVSVCDDRALVTKWKARTQTKRRDTAESARERKGEAAAEAYEDNERPWELNLPIDLKRAKATDKTDKALWEAFVPLIAAAMKEDCPPGRTFIFDYDQVKGPIYFHADGTHEQKAPVHRMGEADPSCIWWAANHFADDADVHLLSIDSDLVPLYLAYHPLATEKRQRVYWHRSLSTDRLRPVMVDLTQQLVPFFRRNVGLPLPWLVLLCCLCGSDFVKRDAYAFNRRGFLDKALQAVRNMLLEAEVTRLLPDLEPTFDVRSTDSILRRFLQHIWSPAAPQVPERFRRPRPPLLTFARLRQLHPTTFPSEGTIAREAAYLDFNLRYWFGACAGKRHDLETDAVKPPPLVYHEDNATSASESSCERTRGE